MPVVCPVCSAENPRILIRDRFEKQNAYLRCRTCGSGFSLMRVENISEAATVHTAVYYTPENEGAATVAEAEKYFLSQLQKFKSSGKLLDVGCGRGKWMHYIREHTRFQVEGVEPSEEAAAYARNAFDLPVITGDLNSASFPESSFDIVYIRHVLEHITEPRTFLAEIRRILKPGGICVVHVPNDASITNAMKRILYRIGFTGEFGSLFYPLHVTGFTPYSLNTLFRNDGFRLLAQRTISKIQRTYEFPLNRKDIPLLPAASLEWMLGKGNLLMGWYEKQ